MTIIKELFQIILMILTIVISGHNIANRFFYELTYKSNTDYPTKLEKEMKEDRKVNERLNKDNNSIESHIERK